MTLAAAEGEAGAMRGPRRGLEAFPGPGGLGGPSGSSRGSGGGGGGPERRAVNNPPAGSRAPCPQWAGELAPRWLLRSGCVCPGPGHPDPVARPALGPAPEAARAEPGSSGDDPREEPAGNGLAQNPVTFRVAPGSPPLRPFLGFRFRSRLLK